GTRSESWNHISGYDVAPAQLHTREVGARGRIDDQVHTYRGAALLFLRLGDDPVRPIREHGHARYAGSDVSVVSGETDEFGIDGRDETAVGLTVTMSGDQDLAAPFTRRNVSTDCEGNEGPAAPVCRHDVEVVPFSPRLPV